jgi:bifunctional non-homologous end joining protein LigD
VRRALGHLPVASFVIDGEIVVFDGDRTSFQALQSGQGGAVLVAFDLLHLLGRDTTGLPIEERTELLRRTLDLSPDPLLRVSEPLAGDVDDLMREACARGWEGLMAKRLGSLYRSGRGPAWRKLKCTTRQELVVAGWTEPTGTRTGFGALLVGYYDEAGALRSAGRVGTGFDERTLRDLYRRLLDTEVAVSPFVDLVREKGAHWVRPELVAEVAFSEWTRDGRLRHPSFIALRDDKAPSEVRREPPSR